MTLRLVPDNPTPEEFPPRVFACEDRMTCYPPCLYCYVAKCPHDMRNAASEDYEPKEDHAA